MDAIVKTDFNFPGQVGKYVGKVRDVYDIDGKYLVMVFPTGFPHSMWSFPRGFRSKARFSIR